MANSFSFFQRNAFIERLTKEAFDLVVIGGGITGAGIALDAVSRGLRVALVEKNDFAYGTSSRSTKLIHGGLRYLKQLEFGLVKEVGSERAIVHKLAPHLVIPEKMLLPLSEKRGLGYWLTSIGLKIYDWLAGVKANDQRKMLTHQQTLKHEPLLRKDDIKGGAIYAEYRADDARLTIEIIKTAVMRGAVILNYCEAKDFIYRDQTICGVLVHDVPTALDFVINAKAVVSAAGPWVDDLRVINKSKTEKHLHLTKGVHIVVPRHKLAIQQAIYFDVDDGRMIFAIPRGNTTYIGTTDTDYSGDKDDVVTSYDDALYLITAVNATFPTVNLTLTDIESSWAGLRPLIHEEGKSASELSRKDEIFVSPTGLMSIAGGKLTGYRKMAERIVDRTIHEHFSEKDFKACYTDRIKFTGADFITTQDVDAYIQKISSVLMEFELSAYATYLVHTYGRQTDIILSSLKDFDGEPEARLIKAELAFAIHYEMALTPLDFFNRRTGMIYFNALRLTKMMNIVLDEFSQYFRWSDDVAAKHKHDLTDAVASTKLFLQTNTQ